MTTLNKTKKGKGSMPKVTNEEGYEVYKKDSDVALFEMMNSLIYKGGFYATADTKIKTFQKLVKENMKADDEFVKANILFSSDRLGIRLAPTLALTDVADRITGDVDKREVSALAKAIYKRPDQIANSMAYAMKFLKKDSIKGLPSFYKKALKKVFEGYKENTLKKFKMKRKDIKLADLIKVLRPKPKNKKMNELYKAIIENRKEASLKETDHITATLSSKTLTKEQKKEIIEKDVSKVPINALVRNLTQYNNSDSKVLNVIEKRLGEVLADRNIAIFNPFDLIFIKSNRNGWKNDSLDIENNISKSIVDMVDKQLYEKFIKQFSFDGQKIAFLLDVSGSMSGNELTNAMKFISVMYPMFGDAKIYPYDNKVHYSLATTLTKVAKKNKKFPNAMAEGMLTMLGASQEIWNGTSTHESIKDVIKKDNPDVIIVVTDETTWNEKDEIDAYTKYYGKSAPNTKFIINNVQPNDKTAFGFRNNIIRMSGIDAKIFSFVQALGSFKRFKEQIKKDYRKFLKKN